MYPADNPAYVLVVTLDEPSVSVAGGGEARTAGATAAPVAAELVRRLSPIVGLRPITDDEAARDWNPSESWSKARLELTGRVSGAGYEEPFSAGAAGARRA